MDLSLSCVVEPFSFITTVPSANVHGIVLVGQITTPGSIKALQLCCLWGYYLAPGILRPVSQ